MKLDKKFYGEIRKAKNDAIVDDTECVVFLAHDDAFAAKPDGAVYHYLQRCFVLHADDEHIDAVRGLIERIENWRRQHPDRLKVPDAKGEKLLP
ncbi:MAG TPA: hypothetical protein VK577_03590 [Bradyrhizobium sp.]|nr:hypothetical protein [Bradyrhizobium sp.]